MKKLISVLLAILVVIPCFSLTSFAWGGITSFEKDGIFYYNYFGDGEVYVAGYNPSYFEDSNYELTIPETVKKGLRKTYTVTGVDMYAFAESNFVKITLPSTITDIGDGAFDSSVELQEVVIPDECEFTYFGADVFLGTMAEEKLFDGDDTAVIGQNVLFGYAGNEKNYVIDEDIDFLASNCFMFSGIESITFNENITEIPYYCFSGCRSLKSVTIPDTIYYINDGAFKDCTSLKSIELGENVEYIGMQCFSNTALETIHLPASIYEFSGAFMDCKTIKSITVDEDNEYFYADENAVYEEWHYEYEDFYGDYVEESGRSLEYYIPSKVEKSITLDSDITQIGDYAFYYCENLEEIYAPSVELIGTQAFCGTDIRIFDADCCLYFHESAFRNCKNLTQIDLKDAWYIGTATFENCTSLKDVKLNPEIGVVDGSAFANTAIEEIEVGGYDLWLGEAVFKDCKNLKKVILADGIYSVGMNTFLNCPELETVYLSKTIDFFEENALNGCENVKFEVIRNTDGHREVKEMGYNFEVVGKLTFLEEISNFFDIISDRIYEILFGWIDSLIENEMM